MRKAQMGAWVRWGHDFEEYTYVSHESRKSTPRITGRYDHHDPTKQHAENHEQASNSRIHINNAMRSFSTKARRVGFSRGWFNCAQKASRLRAQCALPFAFWHRACFLQARLFLSLKQGSWAGNSAPSTSNAVMRRPNFKFSSKTQALEMTRHRL